jgi:FtsH-binding integral membrane protein
MAFAGGDMSLEERFSALDDEKSRFVSKVYTGLTFSLVLATVVCVMAIQWFGAMSRQQMLGTWQVFQFVQLGLIIASIFIRLSGPFGWIFLTGFVTVTGITLAPLLMWYAQFQTGPATIAAALGLTAVIFLTLSAYVRYSGKDFSYLGGFLWMATIGLLITGICLMFWPSENVAYIKAAIGALVFSGWILYDTSAVTREYYRENNVVGAVLALYIDILQLFIYLLRLLHRKD